MWYFAWCDADTEFDPDVHNVEDEDVFSWSVEHSEGEFAQLSVVIRNPRVGLLRAGRKLWAFLAYDKAGVPTPIVKGRLVGIPDNIFDTLVTLKFIARAATFANDKAALAESMKVLPYWDPIFVTPDKWDDPDTVLESRSAHWHIDRVTHELTVSDVIVGEDGTREFMEDDVFTDSVSITLNSVPLRTVAMKATIPWTQSASGGLALGGYLTLRWPRVSGPSYYISSYTLAGLISSWPKVGAKFEGGWSVSAGELTDTSLLVKQTFSLLNSPEICTPDPFNGYMESRWLTPPALEKPIPDGSVTWVARVTGRSWYGKEGTGYDYQVAQLFAPIGYGIPTLNLNYTTSREMGEIVEFTLSTAMQDIVTLPDDQEKMSIELSANKVSDVTRDNTVPIGDVRRRSYAHTARGEQSIQHLIMVARANLVARSRAVEVAFECPLLEGLELTLRMNALVHDHHFPGGQAVGKIISTAFSFDGSTGTGTAKITIGCAIGYGGSYTSQPGNPTYVEDGYVADGYQTRDNKVTLIDTEDVTYTMPAVTYFDDGLDFIRGITADIAVADLQVTDGPDAQRSLLVNDLLGCVDNQDFIQKRFWTFGLKDYISWSFGKYQTPDPSSTAPTEDPVDTYYKTQTIPTTDVAAKLNERPTKIKLTMRPFTGGPFTGEVVVGVSDLIVPKQIDLEAASA